MFAYVNDKTEKKYNDDSTMSQQYARFSYSDFSDEWMFISTVLILPWWKKYIYTQHGNVKTLYYKSCVQIML